MQLMEFFVGVVVLVASIAASYFGKRKALAKLKELQMSD
jgi:uncharacterized protein (UPF0333 family)